MERAGSMMRRVFIGLVINLVGLVLAFGLDASASDAPVPFRVIVNPSVVGHALPRDVLAQIYLGEVERWGDRSLIAAVEVTSWPPIEPPGGAVFAVSLPRLPSVR
jgi:hypothetical protein